MKPSNSPEPAVPATLPRRAPSLALALAATSDPASVSAADMTAFAAEMREQTEKLRRNDFSGVEDMLMHQALALQTLFTRLTTRGLLYSSSATALGEPGGHADLLLRYGLKAQAQCAATLQALGGLKKAPAVFAHQANITTGPQQINNHAAIPLPQPAAANAGSSPGGADDAPTPLREIAALARPADPPLAAVAEIERTADAAGQGDLVAQRVEGRRAPRTARAGKSAS